MHILQGDFFDWSPLNLAESQILCKLAQNFSKCQGYKGILYFENLGGTSQKIHPVHTGSTLCDEDLLKIIFNSKNIGRLPKHFKKICAGITAILLNVITGITSKEGEEDKFVTLVDCPRWATAPPAPLYLSRPFCRINNRLSQLEHQMRVSLATAVARDVEVGKQMAGEVETYSMMDWLNGFPTQTSVLSRQVPPCSSFLSPCSLLLAFCSWLFAPCSLLFALLAPRSY